MTASRLRWCAGAAVVLLVALGAWFGSPSVRHQVRISVSRQQTPFTELYFANDLPSRFSVGEPTTLAFIIANHQGHDLTYAWTATITETDGTTVATMKGRARVPNGLTSGQHLSFTLASSGTYLLTVSLDGRVETIHLQRPA
jgi:hypothetical protein